MTVSRTGQREISCHFEGLSEGAHTAKVTIKSGKYTIDAMQVTGGKIPFEKKKPAKSESTKSGKSKLPIAVGAGVCAAAAVGAVIYGIARKKRKEIMTKISRTTDMTQGSEMRHIIMFSLPLLAGNLLQQTYNIVDTMVVGRYLGDDALAAVGATGSITYLFTPFA